MWKRSEARKQGKIEVGEEMKICMHEKKTKLNEKEEKDSKDKKQRTKKPTQTVHKDTNTN